VHVILKIFDYRRVILVLPKPGSETIRRPVHLGQLPANQRVFVCACLPTYLSLQMKCSIYKSTG